MVQIEGKRRKDLNEEDQLTFIFGDGPVWSLFLPSVGVTGLDVFDLVLLHTAHTFVDAGLCSVQYSHSHCSTSSFC